MAAPFVTGAAALLMEWGIVRGNDLYMYGDKLKASLIKVPVKMYLQLPHGLSLKTLPKIQNTPTL